MEVKCPQGQYTVYLDDDALSSPDIYHGDRGITIALTVHCPECDYEEVVEGVSKGWNAWN